MKSAKTKAKNLIPLITIIIVLAIWQAVSMAEIIPNYMLPSPVQMIQAFILDFPLLMYHLKVTIVEAVIGLAIGCGLGFAVAVLMDSFDGARRAVYPLLVITQTIPTVAIAPLLILWLGYAEAPKIVLVVITSFFPLAVALLDGFTSVDVDTLNLMKSMGAGRAQLFYHLKIPASLGRFFSGLRISATYSIVSAVIAEWIGGYAGLGVYMMRVKKSYSYDKMFAVILLIVLLSLGLIWVIKKVEKKAMPWRKEKI